MDQKSLKNLALSLSDRLLSEKEKLSSQPFKHLYIDNFLPMELSNNILNHFPSVDNNWNFSNDSEIEIKYRTKWECEFDIPDHIINFVRILNSSLFLKSLSNVFKIPKIIPDPYFTGGGLNVTKRNGLLDVHVDGNYHDATGLHRRLNVIYFLNPNWQPEWKGEFGLYDNNGEHCLKKIEPINNRLVIFDTHDKSFHGYPDPILFPINDPRKSLILYYYTADRRDIGNDVYQDPHSALWKKKNFHDKKGNLKRDKFE